MEKKKLYKKKNKKKNRKAIIMKLENNIIESIG